MSHYEKIRLPLAQEDGAVIHHTLKGRFLVGIGRSDGTPGMWAWATGDEEKQWGHVRWFVIRSASGKLVTYQKNADGRSAVAVYDSFEAMQPNVPPSIYDDAMERAGLKEPQQFPEVPLEGV